jgi:hypothetical protein
VDTGDTLSIYQGNGNRADQGSLITSFTKNLSPSEAGEMVTINDNGTPRTVTKAQALLIQAARNVSRATGSFQPPAQGGSPSGQPNTPEAMTSALSTPSLMGTPGQPLPGTGQPSAGAPPRPTAPAAAPPTLENSAIGSGLSPYTQQAQTNMAAYKAQLVNDTAAAKNQEISNNTQADLLFKAMTGGLQDVKNQLASFVSSARTSWFDKPEDKTALVNSISGSGSDTATLQDAEALRKLFGAAAVQNTANLVTPGTPLNKYLEQTGASINPNETMQQGAIGHLLQYGSRLANNKIAENSLFDQYAADPATKGSIERFPAWFANEMTKNGSYGTGQQPALVQGIPSSPALEAAAKAALAPDQSQYKTFDMAHAQDAYNILRKDPNQRKIFEQTYGPGSSLSVLGAAVQ